MVAVARVTRVWAAGAEVDVGSSPAQGGGELLGLGERDEGVVGAVQDEEGLGRRR
ncbi:hypothetical protein ABZ619_09015 [Streptomyces sp. NPDC007851]|uniref:hypothetical protein n=1 Tax=Streptomyces sp. NPDC007851 TaxID=3155008 RepID=UPI0033DD0DBC